MCPWLAMNWQSSCLSFLSIKITGRHDHTCQRDNTLGKVILCKTNKSVNLKMCEDQREDICGSVSAHFWPQPAAVTHNYLVVQKCVCLPVHIAYTFPHMCPHIYIRKKTDSQCVLRSASAHHSCLFLFSLALQF